MDLFGEGLTHPRRTSDMHSRGWRKGSGDKPYVWTGPHTVTVDNKAAGGCVKWLDTSPVVC